MSYPENNDCPGPDNAVKLDNDQAMPLRTRIAIEMLKVLQLGQFRDFRPNRDSAIKAVDMSIDLTDRLLTRLSQSEPKP